MVDFSHLAARWLNTDCQTSDWCSGADLDKSGTVDLGDYARFTRVLLKNSNLFTFNDCYEAGVKRRTFHDIRRTAITNWFYQGLSIYDVMKLAGHSKFETTYKFYLQVKDGLLDRARKTTIYTVSPELLQKCCSRDVRGSSRKAAERKCLTSLNI